MKILVLTRASWSSENNTGNTMNNIFGGFKDVEIHNLYLRTELPKNNPCKTIYRISEQQLIKSILKRTNCGGVISNVNCEDVGENEDADKEVNVYKKAKKTKLFFPWFVREGIWSLGKWKHKEFEQYLKSVSPDVIFMPVFSCWYPCKVLKYIHKITGAKVVLFHTDDNYTLKQHSWSPLYWLYRFNLRKWIRRIEKISSLDYAISDIQCNEYSKAFNKDVKILYKGQHFDEMPVVKEPNGVIKMVFTGNISSGRYKTLSLIGKAIDNINADEKKVELDIYTRTPITEKMKKALSADGINLKGGVGADKIMEIQRNADILVHVESFERKYKLSVRQSFSTKIVDYLYNAKCVFAVGPKEVASIDYLIKNDAAMVASSKNDVEQALIQLVEHPNMICEYGKKAWECGEKRHQIEVIQDNLYKDFTKLLEE